jgi:hypothetical protein
MSRNFDHLLNSNNPKNIETTLVQLNVELAEARAQQVILDAQLKESMAKITTDLKVIGCSLLNLISFFTGLIRGKK